MKRMISFFCILSLIVCLFSIPVYSLELEERTIPTYEVFMKVFDDLSLLFNKKDVYIKIKDLINLTGYSLKKNGTEMYFYKGNRKVIVKNDKIKYGSVSDKIKIIKYNEDDYISFLPTIDYFNMRIDATSKGLIIYNTSYTYSELIDDMIDVLDNDILKIPEVSNITNGLSWINKLIDCDISTIRNDMRLEKVILRILKEDDTDKLSTNQSLENIISFGVDINSILDNIGHLDDIPETYLDYLPKSELVDMVGSFKEISEYELDIINYSLQIGCLYKKNIDNLNKVISNNNFMPFKKNGYIYNISKKYIDAYGDGEKQVKLLYDYFIKKSDSVVGESILGSCLPYSLQSGLSVYSVLVGNLFNIYDYSEIIMYQRDFNIIQSLIIKEINQLLIKISLGKELNNDVKEYFIYLSRLYFQITLAYYDYMGEEDGENSSYDNVKQIAKERINKIDFIGVEAMLFDNPKYDSSNMENKDLIDLYKNIFFDNRYNIYLKKYQEIVEDFDNITAIQLVDLDSNGIPELLIYREETYNDCLVYSINVSNETYLVDKIYLNYSTFKKIDDIYYMDNFIRTSTDGQHKIYKGLIKVLDISYGKVDLFGNNDSNYEFYREENSITEEEYDELISAYQFNNEFNLLKQYGVTDDLIVDNSEYGVILSNLMNKYKEKNN